LVRLILDSSTGGYPVIIGSNVQRELRNVVTRLDPTGAAIITDANVRPWANRVAKAIKRAGLRTVIHAVPAGERAKTMGHLNEVLSFLERQRIDRGGIVIAVGGGTVGDVAGLAAAIWQRGVRLVGVPTTLLAMVDSSIGGKTGVNGLRSKNAIGAFWQPSAVISDIAALQTLPVPSYRDAFAEVVKYAVAMDRGLFDLLLRNAPRLVDDRDPAMLERVVFRCVAAKALIVAKDERDRGPRAILNYGHTAGHALEAATRFRVSHGRGVAFGMRVAAQIAVSMDLCSRRLVDAQDALLDAFGLPDRAPAADPKRVLAAIALDKKALRGKVAWVLPRRIGHAEIGHTVPGALVRRVVTRALA
jgi:3-dehydroquinate synthase